MGKYSPILAWVKVNATLKAHCRDCLWFREEGDIPTARSHVIAHPTHTVRVESRVVTDLIRPARQVVDDVAA